MFRPGAPFPLIFRDAFWMSLGEASRVERTPGLSDRDLGPVVYRVVTARGRRGEDQRANPARPVQAHQLGDHPSEGLAISVRSTDIELIQQCDGVVDEGLHRT